MEVKAQGFVVAHRDVDLILGRPWERAVRAQYINEANRSYTVVIKSQDERKIVQLCAVEANHERNREYVRHAKEGVIGEDF